MFCKKGVLRNFAGKHLCQSLFNKVAGLIVKTVLNKRSGKLKIVLQTVRMTIFVLKYITDKRWSHPIANFIHFNCKILNISIVNRDRTISSRSSSKMTVRHYELYVNIFHVTCLFSYLLCDCDTSKPINSN